MAMYPNYPYLNYISWYPYMYEIQPYRTNDFHYFNGYYPFAYPQRQQPVSGHATWTLGGQTTKCGIPWSENGYMTAAVGETSPYNCGQSLKIRHYTNLGPREVIVTIVDEVRGFPPNRINLHRRAFEALGARPEQGVIPIEIIPNPELEEEKWGKYLLEVAEIAYPNFNITDYNQTQKTEISSDQVKETYEFLLESPQNGQIKIQGNVIYNPNTDKVISFDIKEVPL
jgi:hypothetical protein